MNDQSLLVYAGTDGSISIFNLVAGMMGYGVDPVTMMGVAGIAVVGDSVSMAASAYNSTPPGRDRWRAAALTFAGFALAGSIPLLLILGLGEVNPAIALAVTAVTSAVVVNVLHYVSDKKRPSTRDVAHRSATILVGICLTYAIGSVIGTR